MADTEDVLECIYCLCFRDSSAGLFCLQVSVTVFFITVIIFVRFIEYRYTVIQYLKDWKTVRYVGIYLLIEYYYLFIIIFGPILFNLLCLVSVSFAYH